MKPYNVEIFDRQFNLKYSTLIGENEFTYKFDLISPVKNNLYLPLDFKPEKISSEVNVPIGWYIRICRDDEEYQGVISGTEYEETRCKVEYKQLITIFDTNLVVPINHSGSIENYIGWYLISTFVENTDTYQNIYGLKRTSLQVPSSYTDGIFDFQKETGDYANINLLTDVILYAAKTYNIITTVEFNFVDPASYGNFWVTINKRGNNTTLPTVETDIGNSITVLTNISDTKDKINRADIQDTFLSTTYRYYLHPDRTYNTTNSNRIVPVKDEDDFFSSESAAETWVSNYFAQRTAAINATYDEYLLKLDRLYSNTWYSHYDSDAFMTFANYLESICPKIHSTTQFKVTYPANSTYPSWQVKDGSYWYAISDNHWSDWDNGGGTYTVTEEVYGEHNIPDTCNTTYTYCGKWDDLRIQSVCYTKYTGKYFNTNNSVGNFNSDDWPDGGTMETPIIYKGSFYLRYDGSSIEGSVTVEVPAKQSEFETFINNDKQAALTAETAWQEANHDRLVQEKAPEVSASEAAKRAGNIFGKNTYSNLIELTVAKDDPLIKPFSMIEPIEDFPAVGKAMNIIHNGKSYNSVLTGMEIGAGKAKLIFGTVRLDLTKILNMKGV